MSVKSEEKLYSEGSAEGGSSAISVLAGAACGLSSVAGQAVQELGRPFANRILLIEDAYVAGTTHVEGIQEMLEGVGDGCKLGFMRDPDNIYDEWAVKVLLSGKGHIGYLPADLNQIVARLMDGGKCVYGQVSKVEQLGAWTKVSMEVYLDD